MRYPGFADPAQLKILSKVVDDHCLDNGVDGPTEREEVATRVMALFRSGTCKADELKKALQQAA